MLRYDFIERDGESNLASVMKNGKWGVVKQENGKEKTIIPIKYDEKPITDRDLIFVYEEDHQKVYNHNGLQIIKQDCYQVDIIQGNKLLVSDKNKNKAIYDKEGNLLVPYNERIVYINDDLIFVSKDGKWGVINIQNEVKLPFEYDQFSFYSDELFICTKDGLQGVIDYDLKEVLPIKYTSIKINYWYIVATIKEECILFKHSGKKVLTQSGYDALIPIDKHVILLRNKDKFGAIILGKTVFETVIIPCEYLHIYRNDDVFAVRGKNNKWGIMDMSGKMLSTCKYDSIGDFREGYTAVTRNGMKGYINKQGKYATKIKYEDCRRIGDSKYVKVKLNGRWALAELDGKELTKFIYDHIAGFTDDTHIEVLYDGYRGEISVKNN